MFRRFLVVMVLSLAVRCAEAQQPRLLIVGTVHLNNPGHDLFNIKVDDVLTAERQKQIAALVDDLARFRPTRVALECSPDRQAFFDERYAKFRAGEYTLGRDERDQIGLRLAAKLKLPRVDCVDYQGDAPGSGEAYDFMQFAQTHDSMNSLVSEIMAAGKRMTEEETAFLATHSLVDWYRRANTPASLRESDAMYVRYIADIGDETVHPGANWVGTWHARNLIILDNLRRIAKPGDRVFTLFGAGHGYLLHQFATQSGAFDVVDTETYLR